MTFDIRQLRYAIAVADHGSFHRAAEAMEVEQSTLSRNVLKLERLIGVKIFDRSHAGTTLTIAGRQFIRRARPMVACADKLASIMRATRQGALLQRLAAVRGRLSLCADQAAAAKWWLSMPMASVSAEGPMPKALSTRRTSPLMPGCRHQGRACPLRRARMTSNPLIVA